ncbi:MULTISPECIES: carboxypeptidase-like regulatory domain-containing protein [Rufibacter]|uniref:5-hydroxyisourate hydrolase-like protein (Transthyretin family) n=1 Tax=Rufibacter quisquiliarum TaxID=1549639 RepID=A0A839GLB2_9BACT|nr:MULTISPECIES: carboxypeptidase-like regulatory domain-containing protein [Rufibacter]MBA9075766.1 5-hydroxyisourate hydrolase-like protein (transthyretin family) [Rufibacter quisquiliarum]
MNKKAFLLLCLLLAVAGTGFAQTKGLVVDKATKKPVPYANIWVENENLGTTGNEKGEFLFPSVLPKDKTLIISCLGYERRRVSVVGNYLRVELTPAAISLQEVTVRKNTRRQKRILNRLDANTEFTFGSNGVPWMVAQYFPNQPTYTATPFLDEIALVTSSNIKNASFKMRLLQVTEDGKPGQDLLPVPLLAVAPKGIKTVKLDLSQYNLQLPPKGVFVAFEWLIIPRNRYQNTDPETGLPFASSSVSYEPSVRSYKPSDKAHNGWIYDKGQWLSTNVSEAEAISLAKPHFQLTLSD